LASKLVATVSLGLASKSVIGFLVELQNQGGAGFFRLGLKIGSNGLVIWVSKSQRRFLGLSLKIGSNGLVIWVSKSQRQFIGLGIKTKWATICRLRYKTDGSMRRRGTRIEI
jgi:hypothetical protein